MRTDGVLVRSAQPEDIPAIIAMCREVYPGTRPWSDSQLGSHQAVFPEGQLVAVDEPSGDILGAAFSLIVLWDDYSMDTSWRDFTERGTFMNHDTSGRTLYGAEVMVRPSSQGRGIGKRLYQGRRELVQRFALRRIRAGARLRGYHQYASEMTPEQYAQEVETGRIGDPTLTFQLRQGFRILAVVREYLRYDPESLGNAAVVEWIPPESEAKGLGHAD